MKKINSLKNRFGLVGAILAFLATSFGVTSCRPDFDLDKRMPEWLGTSIYETLDKGFYQNDTTNSGKFYSFKYFVRLIDDLGQKEILAKTGSKTLFVASDEAFEEFFKNCPFKGVSSYEDLTEAQKKMILNGSMLNNVYQVAMLSSSPGGEQNPPLLGNCMRRVSASQTLDSIPVVLPDDMPDNSFWAYQREKSDKGIVLLQDGTNRPLVFFVPKFMQMHGFDNDDYDFLFRLGRYSLPGNPKPAHDPASASVNGAVIEKPNKKCFNGFLHVMSQVVYLLPNMAEELQTNDSTKIYSAIIERFSAPTYVRGERTNRDQNIRSMIANPNSKISQAVKDAMDASNDSVYVKKYLSQRANPSSGNGGSGNASPFQTDVWGNTLLGTNELLKFDPGWNSLLPPSSNEAAIALQEDIAVMFVPTDGPLKDWWLNGVGAKLRERYGDPELKGRTDLSIEEVIKDMKGIPLGVIVELVNNNMQNSLISSIPSKFGTVLDDAQDPFFGNKTTRDQAERTISDVAMCCNGAIYFTNKVYTPTAYKSVSYPVLVNEKLKIINWAVKDVKLAYKAYLNSTVAEYSFFVPVIDTVGTFEGKLVWIDPASFYLKKYKTTDPLGSIKALAFSYGKYGGKETVMADVYNFNDTTGQFTPTGQTLRANDGSSTEDNATKYIRNRLLDLMDYHIVIGEVEADSVPQVTIGGKKYSYFKTKGGGTIRFKNSATFGDITDMEVAGGWQLENEGQPDEVQRPVTIIERVDLNKKTSKSDGNGRTYIIDRPLLPSRLSVYDVVSDTVTYPEFAAFFRLMNEAQIFSSKVNRHEVASQRAVSTFSAYHYTVYIPKNDAVQDLIDSKKLVFSSELNDIDTKFKNYQTQLNRVYRGNPNKDSLVFNDLADSILKISEEYYGITDKEVILASLKAKKTADSPTKAFSDMKRNQLINFVKYHIQDNSVYVGSSFSAGVDEETGVPVQKAKYETAYLKGSQFVKLWVKGGSTIELTDQKGNVRRVVTDTPTPSGKPYYNIMCREYEIRPLDSSHELKDDTYATDFFIEAASNAVVHLIDAPLCSGDFNF